MYTYKRFLKLTSSPAKAVIFRGTIGFKYSGHSGMSPIRMRLSYWTEALCYEIPSPDRIEKTQVNGRMC